MKFLLSILMLSSFSAFSSELSIEEAIHTSAYELAGGPISGAQTNQVKKAINNDLSLNSFNCSGKWGLSEVRSYFSTYIKDVNEATISLEDSNTSPVITAENQQASYGFTFKFTTSPDQKRIVSIFLTYSNYAVTEQNLGTLMNPRFENVKTATQTWITNCKATNI